MANLSNINNKFLVTTGGDVGLNTTSPRKKLEVAGSYKLGTNSYIEYNGVYPYTISILNTAGVGNLIFNAGSGSAGHESKIELQGGTNGYLVFSTTSIEKMRIDSSGHVSIGQDVGGSAFNGASVLRLSPYTSGQPVYIGLKSNASNNCGILMGDSDDSYVGGFIYNNPNNYLVINTNNAERMRIDSNGNFGLNTQAENSAGTWRNFNFGSLSMFGRANNANPDGGIGTNFKFTTANAEQRISAHATSRIWFNDDQINFDNAGTGLADSTINWNNRMAIDSSGTVQVRNQTPTIQLYNTDTSLVANQLIGTVDFYKSDGSGAGAGVSASIQVRSDSSIGAKSYMAFHTDNGTGLQNAERMRITSAGNIIFGNAGVQTNVPLQVDYSSGNASLYGQLNQTMYFNARPNGTTEGMAFQINGNTDMFLRRDGNVGIGTTSPATYLQIGDYPSNNIDITTYPDVPSEHMIHLSAPETNTRYGAGISFGEDSFTAANITVQDAGGNGALNMLFGTRHTSGTVQERMRIDSSGVVSITNSFNGINALVENDTHNAVFQIKASAAGKNSEIWFGDSADGNIGKIDYDHNDNSMALTTNATERMRITSGGDIQVTGGSFYNSSSGITYIGNNSEFEFVDSLASGTKRFRPGVDNSFDLGDSSRRWDDVWATNPQIQTSDRNEKNTIKDTDLGLDFINKLKPVSYIWNNKTRTHYGLIAQDVEDLLSEINKDTKDFAGFIKADVSEEKDNIKYSYGLRYNEFISPMIKAIQELKADNDSLKARIKTLENK